MKRRLLLLALLAAGAAHAETHVVRIEGMQFLPASLVVHRGDKVTWQNRDLVPHSASAAGHFDTKVIAPDKSATLVMNKAGHFDYVCTLHPTMKATLVVQ
jgi:plastocyanin